MQPAESSIGRRANTAKSIRKRAGWNTTQKRSGKMCSRCFVSWRAETLSRSLRRLRWRLPISAKRSSCSTSGQVVRCIMRLCGSAAGASRFARNSASAGHDETVRAKTGLKLDTYFSGSKLKWLIDAKPDIRQQLENGDALLGTMDTYLIYRLTKTEVFATDHTNASRTLLYDIGRLRWDEQLCCLFNVPMRALAEVRESFEQFGATDADGALPQTLCICGVMGDSQASLLAQGCYERGACKATFGSGTSILLNTGDRFESSDRGAVSAIAWVWQGSPTYALEGIINYSSATIAWLKDQLGLIADPSETAALAQAVTDNGGVYLVPAFAGLSAPYWRSNARAAIVGMSAHSRKEHIVRAALESIAYQIRDVLEMMRLNGGVVPQVLFADGGPTCNEFLMQFTADILRLELIVAEIPESSARGAAMAAMLGRGTVASFDELSSLPRTVRRFEPQMEAAAAERLYSEWQIAVERVF